MPVATAVRSFLSDLRSPKWPASERANYPYSLNQWMWDYANFSFNGINYGMQGPAMTMSGNEERIEPSYSGRVNGTLFGNAVVFACERVRTSVFSQMRFQFRRVVNGKPGDLFGTKELQLLERPWMGGTTRDLLALMLLDADFAGNAFVTRRVGMLQRLRPDWMTLVYGSMSDSSVDAWDLDAELIGYLYQPGGPGSGEDPIALSPMQVAHFAPMPDPLSPRRGMSWLTPVIREITGDSGMTTHKNAFLSNAATPNLVVKAVPIPGIPAMTTDVFNKWVDEFEAGHTGAFNAYKTIYLGGGFDATVVGANMQQMDFANVQGAGEVRIAAAAGVHPTIVGLSEGLKGSSLNAGNFQAARRLFADVVARDLWNAAVGSLAQIINVPGGAELWYDETNVSFLQEDQKDAAEIEQIQAIAVRQLLEAGYEADAVIDFVLSKDLSKLKGRHTGLFSIQLQAPGAPKMPEGEVPGEKPVGPGTAPEKAPAGASPSGNGKSAFPPAG